MNDFLQSLRNGQAEKPRTPKTRKNSDTSYQYNNNPRFNSYGGGSGYQNTRNHQMKRPQSQGMPQQMGNQIPAEDANITLLADILENLSNHVETLVKNQDYMVNIQERTADMLERQAIAIERIAGHLNLDPALDSPMDMPQDPDAQPAFENHYTTSREPEEATEDNLGNSWEEPVSAPFVQPVVKEANKIQTPPSVKKVDTGKPVLRKRRKIVAKEIIAPKTTLPKAPAKKSPKPSRSPKSPIAQKSPRAPVSPKTTVSIDAKLMPRDAIMDIIESMRKDGATFDQVAKRLVDLGQPTFSGRGEWHAQTIHRLCSKK
jgi:hypothetical protein